MGWLRSRTSTYLRSWGSGEEALNTDLVVGRQPLVNLPSNLGTASRSGFCQTAAASSPDTERVAPMQKALKIGGFVAGAVLIVFGIVAIALGAWGGHTVNKNLKNEFIVGTPDMTPTAIQPEVDAIKAQQQKIAAAQKKAKIPPAQQTTFTTVEAPSCSVAGQPVDNGSRAACFGNYMRIHALGSSNGLTYAQMGQYAAKPDAPVQFTDFNGGTSDTKYAQVDPTTGRPVSNGARNVWVSETSLSTALYLALAATGISLFGIVVGIALLLSGIGFLILAASGAIQRVPFTSEKTSSEAPVVPASGSE